MHGHSLWCEMMKPDQSKAQTHSDFKCVIMHALQAYPKSGGQTKSFQQSWVCLACCNATRKERVPIHEVIVKQGMRLHSQSEYSLATMRQTNLVRKFIIMKIGTSVSFINLAWLLATESEVCTLF